MKRRTFCELSDVCLKPFLMARGLVDDEVQGALPVHHKSHLALERDCETLLAVLRLDLKFGDRLFDSSDLAGPQPGNQNIFVIVFVGVDVSFG